MDEDPAMTDLLKMALEPMNFKVHTAYPNSKGIEVIFNTYYDVVIVELLKSDDDGLQVCRDIRSISQVPIVVLSVVNKPGMVEQALDSGADEYLLKPVPTSVLTARLNTLARRARAEWEAANHRKLGSAIGMG
jgi:two-component system KDP operon response regulator KdpE